MKKYTYFFTYFQDRQASFGHLSIIAANVSMANRMFDYLYVKGIDNDRCCAFTGKASINGVEINVTSISESESLS